MKCLINEDGTRTIAESEQLSATEGYCVFDVKACGICGSDIPRVNAGKSYYYPIVLGHEFCGVVRDSTRKELIGKRACVFPILPCGECEFCKAEQWASCRSYDYYGSRRDGGMQSSLLIKESNLIFLPDGVSDDAGAMIEPTAVCLHAVKKAAIKSGDTVCIYGAGTIGLLCGMWAWIFGAGKVVFCDVDETRMSFARELGFEAHNGEEAECVIEASGHPVALNKAIETAKAMGTVVLVGHGGGDVVIKHDVFVKVLRKQLLVVGSWNSDRRGDVDDWRDSVDAIASGALTPERIITHRIALENADEAFNVICNRTEFYNKVVLVM